MEPPTSVHILGVNGQGYEAGNATITAGRTLPWLQDRADVDVYGLWEVSTRDLIILDSANSYYAEFSLLEHDLTNPDDYAALKALLLEAAGYEGD